MRIPFIYLMMIFMTTSISAENWHKVSDFDKNHKTSITNNLSENSLLTTTDITLSVDLSQYTGAFTTAYINGDFNGWNGTANPLTDQGTRVPRGRLGLQEPF